MGDGWLELYLAGRPRLFSSPSSYREGVFASFGFPFDGTSWFRPGSRFGPTAIRSASEGLESAYLAPKLRLIDLGDLPPTNSLRWGLRRAWRVARKVIGDGKVPVALGGEHSLSLATVSAVCGKGCSLIVFDAHFDMRDEFLDTRVNSATWLRRLVEKKTLKVMVVGVRGFDPEEKKFAEEMNVTYYGGQEVEESFDKVLREVGEFAEKSREVYLSIDVDVLDPAYAPGVACPEPCGITPQKLHALIRGACKGKILGIDVVEVNPLFDQGQTAAQAARILLEAFSAITTSSET